MRGQGCYILCTKEWAVHCTAYCKPCTALGSLIIWDPSRGRPVLSHDPRNLKSPRISESFDWFIWQVQCTWYLAAYAYAASCFEIPYYFPFDSHSKRSILSSYGYSTFESVCTCIVIFTSSEVYLDDVVDGGVEMKVVHVYVKEKQRTTSALGATPRCNARWVMWAKLRKRLCAECC